ncbi:MAG: TIGR03905 family TSCPD domain-containing protein [Candidatus Bathyarchaeota archaeon]|nr:TIGR03905 family TSCPD domain-containing protein [Candidatus Bathyarchaeota archaeon]
MKKRAYQTSGTCSEKIQFNIADGKVTNVEFVGGCEGNSQGISKLVEGMEIGDVIARLKGIDCDGKGTSCPDQLAHALEDYVNEN